MCACVRVRVLFAEEQWTAYKKANAAIANAVRAMVGPSPDNDLIWIHNYHLLQVPFELRKLGITSRIGTLILLFIIIRPFNS